MDSPNSLLTGFYTLLSYSYSERHTYLMLGSWKRDIGAVNLSDRPITVSFNASCLIHRRSRTLLHFYLASTACRPSANSLEAYTAGHRLD
jgi:hypothetical protein